MTITPAKDEFTISGLFESFLYTIHVMESDQRCPWTPTSLEKSPICCRLFRLIWGNGWVGFPILSLTSETEQDANLRSILWKRGSSPIEPAQLRAVVSYWLVHHKTMSSVNKYGISPVKKRMLLSTHLSLIIKCFSREYTTTSIIFLARLLMEYGHLMVGYTQQETRLLVSTALVNMRRHRAKTAWLLSSGGSFCSRRV